MTGHTTSTFSVRLALTAHQRARQFSSRHANPAKAKQVYLNTLAVYAVQTYLECLGIDVDLTASQSWNPVQQTLLSIADIVVPQWGTLECCPIAPNADAMVIPPEVWSDRQGYVGVQFDESLRHAELVGWSADVSTENVPLTALSGIDTLSAQILQRRQSEAPQASSLVAEGGSERTNLGRWLQRLVDDVVDAGWQLADEMLRPSGELQAEFGFRGDRAESALSDSSEVAVAYRKPVLFPTVQGQVEIYLIVGLIPQSDSETEVWVQLSPTIPEERLPAQLRLVILDEEGEEVMNVQARETDAMQLRFSGQSGEEFSVKVELDQESMVHHFVI